MKNKLVFIGNSIVNGFPFSRGKSFPGLIRAAVSEGSAPFHADIINKGANGETTADILRRFEHDVLDHEPNAFFIMTGTNDFIYREADPAQCMENLQRMADEAEERGVAAVFMTPLRTDGPMASRMWMAGAGIDYDQINGQIDAFSEAIRRGGRLVCDTGTVWEEWARKQSSAGGQAYRDGVHPTADGYRFLADTVLKWIIAHADELRLK